MYAGKDNSPPLIDKCNIMRVFVSKQNGADGGGGGVNPEDDIFVKDVNFADID